MNISLTNQHSQSWTEFNRQYLNGAIAEVRAALERCAGAEPSAIFSAPGAPEGGRPPAIENLAAVFRLSPFERAILVWTAAMELDAGFPALCAAAQGDGSRPYPTFGLALAALPDPHWSALTPSGPLRRWSLLEVTPQSALTKSSLRIDERILHYLAGIPELDERLAGLLSPLPPPTDLVPSHATVADLLATIWSRDDEAAAAVQLLGADERSRRSIVQAAAAIVGLPAYALAAEDLPAGAADLEAVLRILTREKALAKSVLYLDCEWLESADTKAERRVWRLLEEVRGPVVASVRQRLSPRGFPLNTIDVRGPSVAEQRELWKSLLQGSGHPDDGLASRLAGQFSLNPESIGATARDAFASGAEGEELARTLWDGSRNEARPRLDDLAQRLEPAAGWNDLVLPEREKSMLREIEMHVRRRGMVYDDWGFGNSSGGRGLGISALFSGGSGTGKTMAAEVLAGLLRLDLYRIDLSSVVNKYIGETEKNLRRVFDAAEGGGAILFFDEADALFGKRSEVKDSLDRYGNIEINYLLQRMESYRGLAVLATNMKGAMDPAFMRRIRFSIHFPFPGPEQRAEIWRRAFPENTPVEGLDIHKLARLNAAGGNIRNIALRAAFLAAEQGGPVRMSHVTHAVHGEFAKIDKPVPEGEIAGW